jgi:hypothetical protein
MAPDGTPKRLKGYNVSGLVSWGIVACQSVCQRSSGGPVWMTTILERADKLASCHKSESHCRSMKYSDALQAGITLFPTLDAAIAAFEEQVDRSGENTPSEG